jgi:MFS family permease
MDRLLLPFRQSKLLNTLFLSNIFISFHYALTLYVNSTFLNGFFSETQVSALYVISSIVNTIVLINASKLIEKIGVYRLAVSTIIVEFFSMMGLALSANPTLIGLYFLIHLVSISMLFVETDIFIESVSKNNALTGSIRATYLTIASVVILIAPSIVALLLIHNTYSNVYLLSALFLFPMYYYIKRFKGLEHGKRKHINIKDTVAEYVKSKDLFNIFISSFLLQLFYAFMVVYTPLYLNKYIGFSWEQIGFMFTIMLLPFVIFEVPIGEMADDTYGEKEFLTIGFVIMGLATLFISFVTVKVFWIWTAVLFITRIGASFVEVSSESYFFKKVSSEKTDIISFFRLSRPLSFIIAPVLATIALQFIPFQYIFILIGATMVLGTHYSLSIKDTK